MGLIRTAEEIKATMKGPAAQPERPEDRLGHQQYALLQIIRSRPYWVVNRVFWTHTAHHLHVLPSKAKQVFKSLEKGGFILVSESEPIIVTTTIENRR